MIRLNQAADSALHKLRAVGGRVYIVGGAVRDTLLGVEPKDIDLIVTGVTPDLIARMPGFYETGEIFGVFRHRKGESEVEIALPRVENSSGPGHKDFDVWVDSTIPLEDDLARRDFTVNAMAWDIDNQELVDPYGGRFDVEKRVVRSINPNAFIDDPLRILRAYVLISRYTMIPLSQTIIDIAGNADKLVDLPAERIQAELDKIFAGDNVAKAMHYMYLHGVLHYIFPEVADTWKYNQNNPHHNRYLGDHHMFTLKYVAEISDDIDLRLAAFLHDIGKPASAWVDPQTGSNHFYQKRFDQGSWIEAGGQVFPKDARWLYNPLGNTHFDIGFNHEDVGADMAQVRLTELKYPTARINRMVAIIRGHMWNPFNTERGARRFINRFGVDLAYDLLNLRFGDQGGKGTYPVGEFNLDEQRELVDLVTSERQPTRTADLAINGHDLIDAGVIEPGPAMGELIAFLTAEVVDDPTVNTWDDLMGMAEIWVAHGGPTVESRG